VSEFVWSSPRAKEVFDAAVALTAAREDVEALKRLADGGKILSSAEKFQAVYTAAKDKRTAARARYNVAYKAYTNPFGVVKTFS